MCSYDQHFKHVLEPMYNQQPSEIQLDSCLMLIIQHPQWDFRLQSKGQVMT